MKKPHIKEEEVTMNTNVIHLQLVADHPMKNDRWPLASLIGGIDKMTIRHRGNRVMVEFVSPEARVTADSWVRPKRGPDSRRDLAAKAAKATPR